MKTMKTLKTREFTYVGVKIIAILLFLYTVKMIVDRVSMWVLMQSYGDRIDFHTAVMYVFVFFVIVFLGTSFYFWIAAGKVTDLFLSGLGQIDQEGEEKGKIETTEFQTVAFNVLGVFLLIKAIPKILYTVGDVLVKHNYYFTTKAAFSPPALDFAAKILEPLVFLVVGIYLLIGFNEISGMFKRLLLRSRKWTGREDTEEKEE